MNETDMRYPALRGRRSADALIIGGGLSGLHTALLLGKAGLNVILTEADRLLSGASGACAGIVSMIGGLSYKRLTDIYGESAARMVLMSQRAAFDKVKALAGDICEWRDESAYIIAVTDKQKRALDAEADAIERAGLPVARGGSQSPLPCKASAMLREQGTIDMDKYVSSLISSVRKLNCRIYEHSRVIAMEKGICYTQTGSVRAPFTIVATGYPILTSPGYPFLKLEHLSAALMTVDISPSFEGMYMTIDGEMMLRKARGGASMVLRLGRAGCASTAAERYREGYQAAPGGAAAVSSRVSQYVKSVDALPLIGAYSSKTPNLMIATGYGRLGIVSSMAAAQAIAARVMGLPFGEYDVYGKSASTPRAVFAIGRNVLGQAGRYIGGVTRVFAPRCRHMGCKLRYDRSRHIWSCPCHGSAYDDLGQTRIAPTVRDARVKHNRARR